MRGHTGPLDYASPDTERVSEACVSVSETPEFTVLVLSPRLSFGFPLAVLLLASIAAGLVLMAVKMRGATPGDDLIFLRGFLLVLAAVMVLTIARESWALRQPAVVHVAEGVVLCRHPGFLRTIARRHELVEGQWAYPSVRDGQSRLVLIRPDGAQALLLASPAGWDGARLGRAAWLINEAIDRRRRNGKTAGDAEISEPWA